MTSQNYAARAHPMQATTFSSHWIPALATAAGVALFVHLGQWQAHKATTEAAELARWEARKTVPAAPLDSHLRSASEMDGAPLRVQGHYVATEQFFLDNRQRDGVAGVEVITPLEITPGGARVLVNRGWLSWGGSRSQLPLAPPPEGEVTVNGAAMVPSKRTFFLMPDRQDPNPQLWNRLDLDRYAAMANKSLQPFVLLQNQGDAQDGLVRAWQPPENRVDMHRSYAWQWYGMALALFVFFCVTRWRNRKTA